MKLSKIFITLMLSMTAYIAQAQLTVQFSWPEYEVSKGEEFIFDVSCETSDSFTAFTCIINLPEGLTPCRWDDDPNEDFEVELTDRAHRTHTISSNFIESANQLRVVAFSSKNSNFTGTSGVIFTVRVKADCVVGMHEIKLVEAESLVTTDEHIDYYSNAFTSGFMMNETNSIDAIEYDNQPAKLYNLQGVEVINPHSGMFIKRQGKKAEKIIIK